MPTTRSAAAVEGELPAIHVELNQQRRFRIEQLDELTLDAAEAVAAEDEPRVQVTRVLKVAAEAALAEIDAALRRLEDGSYGTCERCDEPILAERLEVLPTARLCTRCQYITESGRARSARPAQAWPVAGPRRSEAWR